MDTIHKKEVNHRLKIINGHLKKIQTMVNENAYCIDVLHQTNAVGAALDRVEEVILENHLRTCVKDSFKKERIEEKIIHELLDTFKAGHK